MVVPAGEVVYDSTLDRYFLGDGITLGGNEILGARYDAADGSITLDKLSQGAIDYIEASGGASDHGALTGLGDDDHTQYLLADGTRTLAGDLTVTGTVDGRDVAADGTKLDGIEAGAKDDQGADEVPFTNAEWAAAGAAYNATDVEAALEQLLVNKAEADTNLGSAHQTLTGSRIVDDGDNGYSFFVDLAAAGGNSAQFLLNPATPSATWKATKAATDSVTLLNTGDRLNMIFQGPSDLAINSSPGAAGQVLTSNGSGVSPGWSTPEYMVPIWAEENAPLGNTTYEWAFGNGANAGSGQGLTVYVPSGWNCEVVAMSLTLQSGNATVELDLSGALQGSAANVSVTGGGAGTNTLSSPIAVVNGDRINFHTTSASGTTATNVVTAWLRYYK